MRSGVTKGMAQVSPRIFMKEMESKGTLSGFAIVTPGVTPVGPRLKCSHSIGFSLVQSMMNIHKRQQKQADINITLHQQKQTNETPMTWNYLPVLNKLLQILVTIAIGAGAGFFGILPGDQFVPIAVKFVFYIALPCLITKGIGECIY